MHGGGMAGLLVSIVIGMIIALRISMWTLAKTNRKEIAILMVANVFIFFIVLFFVNSDLINSDVFVLIYPSASSIAILILALTLGFKDTEVSKKNAQDAGSENSEQ